MFPRYRCTADAAKERHKTSLQGLKREPGIDLAEIAFKLSEVERTKERNKAYQAISEKN